MIALLDTEWRRFWARRAVRYLVGGALLLALIVNVVQVARSSANATTYREAMVPRPIDTACVVGHRGDVPIVDEACAFRRLVRRASGRVEVAPPAEMRLERVVVRTVHDRRLHVAHTLSQSIRGMGIPLVFLSLLLTATFLGADFGTSLPGQLVFEPRRVRVYVAKAVAAAAGVAVIAALTIVCNGALQFAGTVWRGIDGATPARWFVHRAGELGLVALASVGGAFIAFAITAVARRTVAAVGVLFGMSISVGFLASTSWGKPIARVLPMNALLAVAQSTFHDLGPDDWVGLHTRAGALVVVGAWAASMTVVAAAIFRDREIR